MLRDLRKKTIEKKDNKSLEEFLEKRSRKYYLEKNYQKNFFFKYLYFLRANGESMIDAGIDDGDLVLIRKQSGAKEGQIVVALVENENTLKRFYKDEENQCIRLHPENKKMTDIIVPNCKIQGVAVKVIKSLE